MRLPVRVLAVLTEPIARGNCCASASALSMCVCTHVYTHVHARRRNELHRRRRSCAYLTAGECNIVYNLLVVYAIRVCAQFAFRARALAHTNNSASRSIAALIIEKPIRYDTRTKRTRKHARSITSQMYVQLFNHIPPHRNRIYTG